MIHAQYCLLYRFLLIRYLSLLRTVTNESQCRDENTKCDLFYYSYNSNIDCSLNINLLPGLKSYTS